MAYTTGKTSALQTAIKAGVEITLAELSAGILGDKPDHTTIMQRVHEVKDSLTPELFKQVDDDNALAGVQAPSPRGNSGGSSGGAPAPSSGPISLEDAKAFALNFGVFKGMTLGNLATMTGDEVKAYTNGKRESPGITYIQWLSRNTEPKAQPSAARAKVVLADFEATGKDLAALASGT